MPTVTMPCFSIWASGTLGKLVTYRRTGKKTIVSLHQKIPKEWSPAQLLHRIGFGKRAKVMKLYKNLGTVVYTDNVRPDFFHIPKRGG